MNGSPSTMTRDALAAAVRTSLARKPSPHGGPQIVAIDGFSGSGKTTLANDLAARLEAPCIHIDEFVPGWRGLEASVGLLVEWVLRPLASGEPAQWRRWDWTLGEYNTTVTWRPDSPLVLVEGCGALSRAARPWNSLNLWLDVSPSERRRRLSLRDDWSYYEEWYDTWREQEEALWMNDDVATQADAIFYESEMISEDEQLVWWKTPAL